MENREEGYYWVKYRGEWIVTSLYHQNRPLAGEIEVFTTTGTEEEFTIGEFDVIGAKIEQPIPEHVCNLTSLITIDKESVKFQSCHCGRVIFYTTTTNKEREHVFRLRTTPGAVFEVVE
jgi:hypothetical protein